MSLRHIYISFAGPDGDVATRLAGHLRDAGHETRVSTLDLTIGSNVIEFMNNGLAGATHVVILFSRHITDAIWQRLEIDSAIWNEHAQGGGKCLVVRLDDTKLPPLLGPRIYGILERDSRSSMQELVDSLCKDILETPAASTIVSQALQRLSRNPFRHLRAEFFENEPNLHAKAFAPPDAVTSGSLRDMKPTFLEGSRGSGKSMLLLSLRARNYILRTGCKGAEVDVFGCYLKLTRGAICNVGMSVGASGVATAAQMTDLTEQELVLQLVESLFSELNFCITSDLIAVDRAAVKALSQAAADQLFENEGVVASTLEELLDAFAKMHKRLAAYIRRRYIYNEQPILPVASFDLAQLKRVMGLVARHVPSLSKAMFVVLLDEYENLLAYQQQVVNTFLKIGPPDLSVKIAKKLASDDTSATTEGQEIQEPHDFSRVSLVFDVADSTQRMRYHELLRHMVRNLCACEGLNGVDVETLLPVDNSPEVTEERLTEEVAKLAKMSNAQFAALSERERRAKRTYYGEAAVYRVLLSGKGSHKDKRFSGFSELAFVSSGVVRYFQEILGVAYHETYGPQWPRDSHLVIPPATQSRAVHVVSRHNLTTLSRNVELHGEELKYFLLDLGDSLRAKLLRHTSEPEAARLTIQDPEMLARPEMLPLRRLLSIGMREGVFQTKEGLPAFKPKHNSDPQPSEFAISRIYAPVLQLSPRLRWRTTVTCQNLVGLARPGNRSEAMQALKAVVIRPRSDEGTQMSFIEADP